MSAPGRRLHQVLAGPVVYWRFFNARKFNLSDSYQGFDLALADDAFDPARRRGLLLTSALWLGEDQTRRQPTKLGVAMVTDTAEQALAMDRRFRDRFER